MSTSTGRKISFSPPDITEEEIDYLIRSVTEVVAYLRRMSPVWRDLQSGKRAFILK